MGADNDAQRHGGRRHCRSVGRHNDAVRGRVFTVVLYLSPSWSPGNRGALRQFAPGVGARDIAPKPNRIVIFAVGAGLFLRTLGQLWAQDPGYDRRNVLMFSVDARLAGKRGADVLLTYRRLLDELKAMPGAQAAAFTL